MVATHGDLSQRRRNAAGSASTQFGFDETGRRAMADVCATLTRTT